MVCAAGELFSSAAGELLSAFGAHFPRDVKLVSLQTPSLEPLRAGKGGDEQHHTCIHISELSPQSCMLCCAQHAFKLAARERSEREASAWMTLDLGGSESKFTERCAKIRRPARNSYHAVIGRLP